MVLYMSCILTLSVFATSDMSTIMGKNRSCSGHIILANFRFSFMEVYRNNGEGRRKYYKQHQHKHK